MTTDQTDLPPEDVNAQADLCQMVGFCLAQFSLIEENLAALYGTTAEIPSIEATFRTHDEIREFQYRLDATDAVVRFWIERIIDQDQRTTLANRWSSLNRRIKEDSQTRNRIAHFTLTPNENDDGTTTWFVCPYFQMFSHWSTVWGEDDKFKIPPGVRKFDLASLTAKLDRFDKTTNRIADFISDLISHGAQPPRLTAHPIDPLGH